MLGRILKPWKWKRKRIPNEHYDSKLATNRVYLAGKTTNLLFIIFYIPSERGILFVGIALATL